MNISRGTGNKIFITLFLFFQLLAWFVTREHSFLREGGGGWAGGIQGRVNNFLPAQKGRVSINLTQQRGGSLKFYCFPWEGDIF